MCSADAVGPCQALPTSFSDIAFLGYVDCVSIVRHLNFAKSRF